MTQRERLRAEWGTVWVKSGCVTHIMPDCRYVSDGHYAVDTDNYPAEWVDLCEFCAERFDNWRDGLAVGDTNRCERCGCRTDNPRHCRDCQTHIERQRARRRL